MFLHLMTSSVDKKGVLIPPFRLTRLNVFRLSRAKMSNFLLN